MKLRLRDFFWLIVVVAVAMGWLADRSRLSRRVDELENVPLKTIDGTGRNVRPHSDDVFGEPFR